MLRARPSRWTSILQAAALPAVLLVASPVSAADNPHIDRLEIVVLSLPDHKDVAHVRPGDTLEIEEGQTVRLRMSAIPARLNPRWPSTRFELESGHRVVSVEGANEEVGNITITGLRDSRGDAVIRFVITDSLNMAKEMRTGSIRVHVRPPAPPPPPPYQPPSVGFSGFILYEDEDFRGRSQNFTSAQVSDLEGTEIGRDRASSIRVEPGCRVTLFEDRGFHGRSAVLTSDSEDLGHTPIGNDRASSFTLDCGERDSGGRTRGVTLYSDAYFHGDSQTFDDDVADLDDMRFNADRASSARIGPGCRAVLYEDAGFRGRSAFIDADVADFSRDGGIGNDTVSSLTVECRGGGY